MTHRPTSVTTILGFDPMPNMYILDGSGAVICSLSNHSHTDIYYRCRKVWTALRATRIGCTDRAPYYFAGTPIYEALMSLMEELTDAPDDPH